MQKIKMPPPVDLLAPVKYPNSIFSQADDLAERVDHLERYYDDNPAIAVRAINTNNVSSPTIITYLTATASWTPGTLASSGKASFLLQMPRAKVGDVVTASLSTALVPGELIQGIVTSTGVVTVTLLNLTGGTTTVAQGTIRVDVAQHQ